jgi:hypothetical protein
MCILKPQIFVQDQARRSFVAIATKASTQRSIEQKDDFQNAYKFMLQSI